MHDADVIDALTAQVNELARTCARLNKETSNCAATCPLLSSRQQVGRMTSPTVAVQPGRPRKLTERRISRRSIGMVLAGFAAGVVGLSRYSRTEMRVIPLVLAAGTSVTAGENAHAELTAVEETAPTVPVPTGSIVSGARSTASGVLNGTNTSTGPGVSGTNTGARRGHPGTEPGQWAGHHRVEQERSRRGLHWARRRPDQARSWCRFSPDQRGTRRPVRGRARSPLVLQEQREETRPGAGSHSDG